jgi:hypothetical protein
MNFNPTSAGPTRPRFVLVNDRVPRADANCALCGARIENGYVRAPRTRLLYCGTRCFSGHEKGALAAFISRARRVS